MRNLITAACIALTATSAHSLERDKQQHMAAGIAVGGLAYIATPALENLLGRDLDPVNMGCAASAAAGLGKELYDATGRGHVEFADFAATAAPWCAAAGVKWFIGVQRDRVTFGIQRRF